MFHRSFSRPFRHSPFDSPPALKRANELMAIGNYPAAAVAFEQLAGAAAGRGGPRAPWLFLQAGRARLLSGQVPAGMEHFQKGLSLFAAQSQFAPLSRSGLSLAAELRQRGLEAEAAQVEAWVRAGLPAGFVPTQAAAGKPRGVLPTNCPGCGAPLRPDEVEWRDSLSAECPYCGSVIRAEE